MSLNVQGIVRGKRIELEHETGLPSGSVVMVTIQPKLLTLEEKLQLVDQLCGTWADDPSLQSIFAEIEHLREQAIARDVEFDEAP